MEQVCAPFRTLAVFGPLLTPSRAFTAASLAHYTPALNRLIDVLFTQLDARAGAPIDASKVAVYFAFDVMGTVGFGKDYGMLETFTKHPAVSGVHGSMKMLQLMGQMPWSLRLFTLMPTFGIESFVGFNKWCAREIDQTIQVSFGDAFKFNMALCLQRQTITESPGDATKVKDINIASILLRDKDAGLGKMSMNAVHDEGRIIILAGRQVIDSLISLLQPIYEY